MKLPRAILRQAQDDEQSRINAIPKGIGYPPVGSEGRAEYRKRPKIFYWLIISNEIY